MTSYDYVIVGAGTAGCVLANRLSEDPATSVLLLEAGADVKPSAMTVPSGWPGLLGTDVDWAFSTVPQQGLNGRALFFPRGRAVGGSSAINGLTHLRAPAANFDAWAASGAKGWSAADMLPYVERADEKFELPRSEGKPFQHAGMAAMRAVGLTQVAFHQLAIADGARQSAADAYLDGETRSRANLSIRAGVLVRRLRVDGGRVTGVEVQVDGTVQVITANNEVVLAAGAIGSPHLLMLSGIGPADHLREHGIDIVADVPAVGANLRDNVLTSVTFAAGKQTPSTAYGVGEVSAMVRTEPAHEPSLQISLAHVPHYEPSLEGPAAGFSIVLGLVAPQSLGWVKLSSADPAAAPLINPNMLGDERDLAPLRQGLRIAREIALQSSMDPWRGDEALPGTGATTDAALDEFLAASAMTYFHPMGTCRLGTGANSVVGLDLLVHGVEGLRIADASVVPGHVSANTNATVMAIAERAVAFIKGVPQ